MFDLHNFLLFFSAFSSCLLAPSTDLFNTKNPLLKNYQNACISCLLLFRSLVLFIVTFHLHQSFLCFTRHIATLPVLCSQPSLTCKSIVALRLDISLETLTLSYWNA